MCKMCNCKGGCCIWGKTLHILLLVGGLNWGLTGLGLILNTNLNIINLIFGNSQFIEAIIYILVGVGAAVSIFGCRCQTCKSGMCNPMNLGSESHQTPNNPINKI